MGYSIFRTCVFIALLSFLLVQCVAERSESDDTDDSLELLLRKQPILPGASRMRKMDDKVLLRIVKNIIKGNAVAAAVGNKKLLRLLKKIVKRGSCNIRICFALDGSGSISKKEYNLQKDLVKLIASAASLDVSAEFSAVQYGLVNKGIYRDIDNQIGKFLRSVIKSKSQKASRTFLAAGLGFCVRSVSNASPGGSQKIVVLGDGRTNFADGTLDIVLDTITTQEVVAVGVGFPQRKSLLTEITGDRSNVYSLKKYSDISRVVPQLVLSLCK